MAVFVAEAEGDTLYVGAETLEEAKRKLGKVCGPIPQSLISWSEVDALPEGEELMAEPS